MIIAVMSVIVCLAIIIYQKKHSIHMVKYRKTTDIEKRALKALGFPIQEKVEVIENEV